MCNNCGTKSHKDQLVKYPEGTTVVAIRPIKELERTLPIGSIGMVRGHCDDGRAMVEFNLIIHTFHFPSDYITVAYPEPASHM